MRDSCGGLRSSYFRTHPFMFITVNARLVAIWAVTSDGGFFWPIFPLLGWGIGLAGNAWDVYARKPITETRSVANSNG